jgi:hypothetical protein
MTTFQNFKNKLTTFMRGVLLAVRNWIGRKVYQKKIAQPLAWRDCGYKLRADTVLGPVEVDKLGTAYQHGNRLYATQHEALMAAQLEYNRRVGDVLARYGSPVTVFVWAD